MSTIDPYSDYAPVKRRVPLMPLLWAALCFVIAMLVMFASVS